LKSFRKLLRIHPCLFFAILVCLAGAWTAVASDAIPSWLQLIEAGTRIENALFRSVPLPGGPVFTRQPPAEARPLLDELVRSEPKNAELYSLRALQDEQALDFDAAEKDWKLFATNSTDRSKAQFALADFYHRRVRPQDEIQALNVFAQLPPSAAEQFTSAARQQSWHAFERIFTVISANALPAETSDAEYRLWIARYPHEAPVYARYFDFLLTRKRFDKAIAFLPEYARAFPGDSVFGVKARALVETRRGNIAQGLAVYEHSFQPLWPQELIQGFFDLLRETQNIRKFLDESRAAIQANPGDLNATARVFHYYQQTQKPDAARQVLAEFRAHKERTHTPWTSEELYMLAELSEGAGDFTEAARYYFALYNTSSTSDPRERALVGLASVLLTAPQAPLRLGAGDLSFYKDVAMLDPDPGFFNGILSLLLNTAAPGQNLSEEEQRALPYFHRARAADLIALLDRDFPNSADRAALHARLVEVYAGYGESDVVARRGQEFLKQFPGAPERTEVSLLMADAYARLNEPEAEFAIYDAVLKELAEKTHHLPLAVAAQQETLQPETPRVTGQDEQNSSQDERAALAPEVQARPRESFAHGADYSRVLERYEARLVALKRLPQALEVLRREVDRNPDDPGLYERLAQFLEQNQMDTQIEVVYRRAMEKFPDRSWYHKLARFYLRRRRQFDLNQLTQQVVKIFAGTDLEAYFHQVVPGGGPRLVLQFNLYANRRFPHDLAFVRNLLNAYQTPQTANAAAWEALLRLHWFEADDLRAEFFAYLSATNRLEAELAALETDNPALRAGHWEEASRANPGAVQYYAAAETWRSHFEAAAPALGVLAASFPGDFGIGRTASSVYRSLAFFDAKNGDAAVRIEQNLLRADPGNRDTLARIGDIYADRDLYSKAASYWSGMATIDPGKSNSFVEAATVYWDYYKFDDALRVLNEGRKKLGSDALFGYEEGAIYETQRDYTRAIAEYIKGALAGSEDSQANTRLLDLARRPKLRAAAEAATRAAVAGDHPPIAAIRLRVRVLDAQQRKADVQAFLLDVLQRAATLEQAQDLESLAQQESLGVVVEQALEREVSLTTDPVARLQLRYRIVQFYEGKKDFDAAQHNIEALYRENSKILGVVRATADFYWQRKMEQRAVDVLLQAAKDSYPELGSKFNFEAARKSTEAGNYALARQLLEKLLLASPYDAELLAAIADTFGRAGDTAGLRDFYLARIEALRKAPLPQDQRIERAAALRRGLIPALTQLKDFSGVVDQYIELINRYPEDAGLSSEAALYAVKHTLAPKLRNFYVKTIADSPRDYRWPIVLARIETTLENYPAALDAYAKAIAARPDRTDLYTARSDLFERLAKYDEAAQDYEKLYALAYHDPQWMMKVAEIRARQGRAEDAIRALRAALIEGRPASPANYFSVAYSLEGWGMLPQAQDFARQGIEAAGIELLANAENHDGARLYVRVMTRLRRQEEAVAVLDKALQDASNASSLSTIVRQVEKQGIAAVTDSEWRAREQQIRHDSGRTGMTVAMKELGETAARYFTPEEKVALQKLLEVNRAGISSSDLNDFLLPAAQAAGLAALEVQWRYDLILADLPHSSGHVMRLVELQSRRLQFRELGQQLEAIAAVSRRDGNGGTLYQAAIAYRAGDFPADELRVLAFIDGGQLLNGETLQRYLKLLLAKQPDNLVALAARGYESRRDAVANFALANASPQLAYRVLLARAQNQPPVWAQSYLALAGLYFNDGDARVNPAFQQALDDKTIGERLGKPVDRRERLAGDVWFYYGTRYGEFEGVTRQGNPEDYLPAELEHKPGSADSYLNSAADYEELGDLPHAIVELQHALELAPDRALIHDKLALLYVKQGNTSLATAEWKRALDVFAKQLIGRGLPENFWTDFDVISARLRERRLGAQFKSDFDKLLRTYIHHNNTYRATPLLRSAYLLLDDPAAGTAWLLDLSSAANPESSFLTEIVLSRWIPAAQRGPLFERIIAVEQSSANQLEGMARENALQEVRMWQGRWIDSLIEAKQFSRASEVLASVTAKPTAEESAEFTLRQIEIAAGLHEFDAVLEGYRTQPESVPPLETLRSAANAIDHLGLKTESRKLFEFVYARAIENRELSAPNFLGLAEIRLQSNDLSGALELLRRLTLVFGQPRENLESSASLLEKTGHPAEAAAFLQHLVSAAPWDSAACLRWAKDRLKAGQDAATARKEFAAIAASPVVSYDLRVDAAEAIGGAAPPTDLGSAELNLLASAKPIPPADADRLFFRAAREKAARVSANSTQRIPLLRAALQDLSNVDSPRVPLFFAAVDSQQYSFALADLDPLLRAGLFSRDAPRFQNDADGEDLDESAGLGADSAEQPEVADAPRLTPQFSSPERARIALNLAVVQEKLENLDEALRYLQIAEKLELRTARRKTIHTNLERVRAIIVRQAADAARRPVIHSALEQDRIVRPRLSSLPASGLSAPLAPQQERP
jgi:tetratricopeptide (TPR) repeat protein